MDSVDFFLHKQDAQPPGTPRGAPLRLFTAGNVPSFKSSLWTFKDAAAFPNSSLVRLVGLREFIFIMAELHVRIQENKVSLCALIWLLCVCLQHGKANTITNY